MNKIAIYQRHMLIDVFASVVLTHIDKILILRKTNKQRFANFCKMVSMSVNFGLYLMNHLISKKKYLHMIECRHFIDYTITSILKYNVVVPANIYKLIFIHIKYK